MSLTKKIVIGLIVVFIGIQSFQPLRNQSSEITDNHIERVYAVPQNVKGILQISCYDCHSNNTHYPWYSRIQPGAWYMSGHVEEGKEELNFSDFGAYSSRRKRNKFRSMSNQVRDGKMPLSSYAVMHQNAVLTKEEKQILMKWFDAMANSLK